MAEKTEIELIKPDWDAPPNVRGFTTTRNGGCSQGPWRSLNFGRSCGDDPAHVEQNRRLLSALLPGEPRWLSQVHGTSAIPWEQAGTPGVKADAVFSTQAGQVCIVQTADCLPVLFCDRAGTRVAAAHAGWRGLAAGVLEATVTALGGEPQNLMAWMGPAIGPEAFEVGRDVYDAFAGLNAENAVAFKPHRDRWLADLYQLARLALERAGVGQVSGGNHCTYTDAERFYSYRRDGVTGRMAAVVWLE